MSKIKKFEQFVSEMDRAEEIEAKIVAKGTPDVKTAEEAEEEAAEVQSVDEAGEASLGANDSAKEIVKPVSEMLKECYEAIIAEAKVWEEDAHDEHTVETYMTENAALVASLAANTLKEMKSDMETEAYEACLNKMSEAYSKKLNEMKEMKDAVDAEDVE
jgi:DUF438 domain-containing protein